jgi:outer membrane protein assembly factor BamB
MDRVFCVLLATGLLLTGSAGAGRADDWPQWLGPQRDGVWRESGVLDKFPEGGPKVLWRAPVGGGYTGPAVAGGRVYVTDRVLAPGTRLPANAFAKSSLPGQERVLCLDAATGQQVWKHEYDCPYRISYPAGPRATPLVHGDKVYTLGAMGDLICFEAATGKVVWSKNFPRDYKADVPLWGFSSHPLLDGDRLVSLVGGEGSAVVAFNKDTGQELWRSLTAPEIGYCPPMVYPVGKSRQLIAWLPDEVHGLEPETGKPLWGVPFTVKAGMTIPTPRLQGNRLFLTAFYSSALMLELADNPPSAKVVWKGKGKNEYPANTQTLHSVMTTPFWVGDFIYGVDSYGELRCLKADTGERVWESLQATGSQKKHPQDRWDNLFLTPNGDRWFLFTEKGELIIARLSPRGYEEVSRAKVIEPTNVMPGRPVVWMHPAYANRCAYIRNDKELICVSLAKE